MKAKFVYENMRFERGGKPYKALNIGLSERIKNILKNINDENFKRLQQWSIRKYNHFGYDPKKYKVEVEGNILQIWFVLWGGGIDYTNNIIENTGLDEFLESDVDAYMDVVAYKIKPEFYQVFEHILNKFIPGGSGVWYTPFLYENMGFERGQDPKSAMGIGIPKGARKAYSAINSRAESLGFERYPVKDIIYSSIGDEWSKDMFAWNKGPYYLYMYDTDPKEEYELYINDPARFYVIGYTLDEDGKDDRYTREEPWEDWMDKDYKYWKEAFPKLIRKYI